MKARRRTSSDQRPTVPPSMGSAVVLARLLGLALIDKMKERETEAYLSEGEGEGEGARLDE